MGVEFLICSLCNKTFPDCGIYDSCTSCKEKLCSKCLDEYNLNEECPFCLRKEATSEKLLDFALKTFNMSKERLLRRYREDEFISDVLFEELEAHQVIQTGHYILRSGKHSETYVNKDLIHAYPYLSKRIIGLLSKLLLPDIDFLVGPAMGGAIFAAKIADRTGLPIAYAEKVNFTESDIEDLEREKDRASRSRNFEKVTALGLEITKAKAALQTKVIIQRGFGSFLSKKKIALIEDIITTGGSVERTIKAIEQCGGKISQIVGIWNRGSWDPKIPLTCLINKVLPDYTPEECPHCQEESK